MPRRHGRVVWLRCRRGACVHGERLSLAGSSLPALRSEGEEGEARGWKGTAPLRSRLLGARESVLGDVVCRRVMP